MRKKPCDNSNRCSRSHARSKLYHYICGQHAPSSQASLSRQQFCICGLLCHEQIVPPHLTIVSERHALITTAGPAGSAQPSVSQQRLQCCTDSKDDSLVMLQFGSRMQHMVSTASSVLLDVDRHKGQLPRETSALRKAMEVGQTRPLESLMHRLR